MKSDIEHLTHLFANFRAERDWEQFNDPKDLAISLALEANELLELFQWKTVAESKAFMKDRPEALRDEIADVLCWTLFIAQCAGIDVIQAVEHKMEKNRQKYPIEKCKGKTTKYTLL